MPLLLLEHATHTQTALLPLVPIFVFRFAQLDMAIALLRDATALDARITL